MTDDSNGMSLIEQVRAAQLPDLDECRRIRTVADITLREIAAKPKRPHASAYARLLQQLKAAVR